MYNSEGIKFDHVDYVDNQPVLDLIELKKTGIMSILDAQMKMPKADDKTFLIQVNKTHKKNKGYYKPYVKKEGHFIVNHYAGEVIYDVCIIHIFTANNMQDKMVARLLFFCVCVLYLS